MRKIAMIPVMFDSSRIPKKNLILLDGQTMAHYVTKACLESDVFDEIYINSEDLIAKTIADDLGVGFYHRKPSNGGSKCSMKNVSVECDGNRCQTHDHFVYDFMNNIQVDCLFQIHTTTPLMEANTIRNFVHYFEEKKYHSVFTVISENRETIYQGKPLNFSYKQKKPTQSLEKVLKMTSGMAAWNTSLYKKRYEEFSKEKNAPSFGDNVGWFEISAVEGIDADNWEDLEIIEAILMYRNKSNNSRQKSYYMTFGYQ